MIGIGIPISHSNKPLPIRRLLIDFDCDKNVHRE
jgi:hypothetical protein